MKFFPTVLSIFLLAAMLTVQSRGEGSSSNTLASSRKQRYYNGDDSPDQWSINRKAVLEILPRQGDGAIHLSLSRLKRKDSIAAFGGKPRVVICNAFSDIDESHSEKAEPSLANYLARHGYEVWEFNLDFYLDRRGCGPMIYVRSSCRNYHDCFRDLTDEIIPRVLQRVAPWNQVVWIGHALGADVMLQHLARHGSNPALCGLVAIGSPFMTSNGRPYYCNAKEQFPQTLARPRLFPSFPTAATGERLLLAPMNQDLLSYSTRELSEKRGAHPPADDRHMPDDDIAYLASLQNVDCPFLTIGGSADPLAPPAVQQWICDNVKSTDRTAISIGRQTGAFVDYGHYDLLIGENASEDVFPKIVDWLNGKR